MSKQRKYTERQRKFARAYVRLGNATKAAIEAGYKPGYANRLGYQLIDKTRELIEQERKKAEEADIIKRDEVFRLWRDLMYGKSPDGEPVPASVRVRASECAAKALGLFVEKRQVEMSGGLTLESLLDEALARAGNK